ncbi:MAG: chemotaxis protein CheD [Bacillota bacterium]|jgi:chemotaxis protein CheD
MSEIIVGMADYRIGKAPDKLVTIGLGSCIGICIYDLSTQIGGMAHIMLPSYQGKKLDNPAKYADSCMALMIEKLLKIGVNRTRLKAKIAGGASMFSLAGDSPLSKIGAYNAEKVKLELKRVGIPLISSDVGGSFGRTISLDLKTGELLIKTINQGYKVI